MAQKNQDKSLWRKYARNVYAILIWVTTYLMVFALISAGITPKRVDVRAGSPSPVTIMATKDVVDTVTTQRLQDEAAAAVETSYKSVEADVLSDILAEMNRMEAQLNAIRKMNDSASDSVLTTVNNLFDVPALTMSDLQYLLKVDEESLSAVFESARSLMADTLDSTLPEGSEEAAVARIERDLKEDEHHSTLVKLATAVAKDTIRPNMIIDAETTDANRQKAREAVEPQMRVKGEVIVREGEIVSISQYQMVSSLGLIADDGLDYWLFGGVALLIAILFGGIIVYIYVFERPLLWDVRILLLIGVINVLVVSLSLVLRELNVYFMPVSLGVFLIAQLIKPRLALIVNISQAIMVSLLASTGSSLFTMSMFSLIMSSVVSSSLVVSVIRRRQARTSILIAGLGIGVINMATTFAMGFISSTSLISVAVNAAWSGASGLLSSVLCIGFQPLLEWVFNLVTPSKLMELSGANQPLMRRLMLEAPGTYQHSMVVANLAEAACTAIGANAMLARVGSYYHDVGKLMRPLYFTENQRGDNPHDRTDPNVSSAILTAHIREGVQLAKKARLPGEVVDIIRQHHGTTPTMYFYAKAQKLYGEDQVKIEDFRYDGPRPQTREAAVVMMADTLEAASRSLQNPTKEKLEELIRKLVRGKMDDGQLDECPLTMRDIALCSEAFLTSLSGAYHQRIEYPEVKIPPKPIQTQQAAAQPAPTAQPVQQPAQAAQPVQQPVQAAQQSAPAAEQPAAEKAAEPAAQPAEQNEGTAKQQ